MILYKKTNNKGADQTARMRRLVCACVVRKPPKTGFPSRSPFYINPAEKMIVILKAQFLNPHPIFLAGEWLSI